MSSRGFTLIEAVVAMVLVSGMGMALFSWVNASISALSRVEEANRRVDATQNALEFMKTVNPMANPSGEVNLKAYRLRWNAVPLTALVDGVNYPEGQSLFLLAQYETEVSVWKDGDAAWISFKIKQVGYQKVRNIRLPFL